MREYYRSPRVAGLREDDDGNLVRGKWEPILSRTDWDRLQDIFDGRLDRFTKSKSYLLTGLLTCATDGGKLVGRPLSGKPRYICQHGVKRDGKPGSVHLGTDTAALDAYVMENAARMKLVNPETVTDLSQGSPELRERLREVEALLDAQADQLAAGVPSANVAKASRKLEAERVELNKELEKSAGAFARLGEEAGREVQPGEERAYVEQLVDHVVVRQAPNRSRVPMWQRVTIVWRDGVEPIMDEETAEAIEKFRKTARDRVAEWNKYSGWGRRPSRRPVMVGDGSNN